jgi:murein DD-endopeptidase MepM/ murein hydrolase activator NlpD
MKKKIFTVLIVSKGGKAPLGFTVSLQTVYLTAAALFLFFLGVAGMFGSNVHLSAVASRLPEVTAENARLQQELAHLEGELGILLGQMAQLEILGREVRDIVSEVAPDDLSYGLGGGYPEKPESLEEALYFLREQIPLKADEMETLLEEVAAYKDEMDATPDFRPAKGRITSRFGWRSSPVSRRTTFHNGIDIGGPRGTKVWAAASGRVVQARYQGGFGNLIVIEHGTYTTYYAHLSKFHVQPGDRVEKGQLIGNVGSTGFSTGPHLHFEIHRDGVPINPLEILN